VIDFVEFVDQKHAWPMLMTQRTQHWTFGKEIRRAGGCGTSMNAVDFELQGLGTHLFTLVPADMLPYKSASAVEPFEDHGRLVRRLPGSVGRVDQDTYSSGPVEPAPSCYGARVQTGSELRSLVSLCPSSCSLFGSLVFKT